MDELDLLVRVSAEGKAMLVHRAIDQLSAALINVQHVQQRLAAEVGFAADFDLLVKRLLELGNLLHALQGTESIEAGH